MNEYLQPGSFVDSTHPKVAAFAAQHAQGANDRERAVALYYAVRDTIRYNPFQNFTLDEAYRGSACVERGEGWCVPKAALLAACRDDPARFQQGLSAGRAATWAAVPPGHS